MTLTARIIDALRLAPNTSAGLAQMLGADQRICSDLLSDLHQMGAVRRELIERDTRGRPPYQYQVA